MDQSHNTKPSVYWPRVTYLGDGVIDVHGRHGKFSGLWELIQTMDTSNALLHNSLDHVKHGGVALQHQVGGIPSIIQDLKGYSQTHTKVKHVVRVLTFYKIIKKLIIGFLFIFFLQAFWTYFISLIWKKPPNYRFFLLKMTIWNTVSPFLLKN